MHPISFRATSISFIFMNLGNFIFLPFRFITLYSPTYTIFCILPNRVQNQAMYPVCFIITCNVHFFSHDITFLGEITCALYATEGKMVKKFNKWGQMGHSILNLNHSPANHFFPCYWWSPKSKPSSPKEANVG